MNLVLLRSLIWTDYRLALIFCVILPLILLLWAFVEKVESMQRLLIIYWRVASLLMITVYLMIPGWPIAFMSSLLARILIPISLWFWVDLNEDIEDQPARPLKLVLTAWRWAITVYSVLGTLFFLPFLPCAFSTAPINDSFCDVWFEAPRLYQQYFHAKYTVGFLGFLGIVGLGIYVVSLCYFILVRLAKEGRSALEH